MAADNRQKFVSVLTAILGIRPEQVSDELSAERIDTWDSLNHINLCSALEQEFGVMLPTEHLADSQSVPRLRALLRERGVEV